MGKYKKRKKPTQKDTSDAEISDNGDNITNDIQLNIFHAFYWLKVYKKIKTSLLYLLSSFKMLF